MQLRSFKKEVVTGYQNGRHFSRDLSLGWTASARQIESRELAAESQNSHRGTRFARRAAFTLGALLPVPSRTAK